ncbi:hypothetical protein CASFOL_016265 [Castilleja foliolosa]|uniref:Uncharacterized protein n=1 Tax=Castilleja foliolosa TaxID=1961234 RepID=A0ABD3DJS1_9LAMI
METVPKRLKLIVTDVELTGGSVEKPGITSYSSSLIKIDIRKVLNPRVRALLDKNLDSIVHSRTITNSNQRLKLTVSDVQFSNSNDVAWRKSRPSSIVDVEVDQRLEPLARDRVKSTLARVQEFYVVGPVDIKPKPQPKPGRPLMGSALTVAKAMAITVLIWFVSRMIAYILCTTRPVEGKNLMPFWPFVIQCLVEPICILGMYLVVFECLYTR